MLTKHYGVGDVIEGRYRVTRELGAGGMGYVVEAEPVAGGSAVALKYCGEDNADARKRFSREVRAMSAIKHANVMPVLDSKTDVAPPFYTMPLAAKSLVADLPVLKASEDAALDAFVFVLDGVQAIHTNGQTHRDLKPLNFLVLADGTILVSDLGLVKIDPRDTAILTETNVFLGTGIYSAPEQWMPGGSRDADARTDVFQLGKCLYEMLTGESPALVDDTKVSNGLSYIIGRATENDPRDRYQTVAQFRDAIEMYRLSKDPAANPLAAFTTVVEQVNKLLTQNKYDAAMLQQLLERLAPLSGDAGVFLEAFESIPKSVLPILAKDFGPALLPLLRQYAEAVDAEAGRRAFSYAESVATRMKAVFRAATTPELKRWALFAVLSASVQLNRFAAMEVFDELLLSVTDTPGALAIAEMLNEHLELYRSVAANAPDAKLAGPIRAARAAALAPHVP